MDYIKLIITTKDRLTGANGLKIWHFLFGIVLALLLAQTSASLTWKIVGLTTAPGEEVAIEGGKGNKPRTLHKISTAARAAAPSEELSLFGEAERVERSSLRLKLDSKAAPETTLALVLKGVITAEPRRRALAIIAEKGKKKDEKLYGIGEKVPGNAVISEIFVDRIILRRGGVLETLMLQNKERANLAKNNKGRGINSSKAIVNLGDGVHWKIDNAYLNQRLGDISSLAREVGVEVYKENNVQKGYRLVSARGSKLLRDMGLQPGDILHEVNGVQLTTIQAGLSVYQKMRSAQTLRVVISRNGRRETRIYEIGSGG
jgi:general secretion pathway protein C